MDDLFEENSFPSSQNQQPDSLVNPPPSLSLELHKDLILQSNLTLLKLPPFTMVQKEPFDPNAYSEAADQFPSLPDHSLDSVEMRSFKAYNIIRHSKQTSPPTNCQLIRWSDGSLSLKIGKEQLEIASVASNSGNSSLLFFPPPSSSPANRLASPSPEKSTLEDQFLLPFGSANSKMIARPFSTSSSAHKRWTAALRPKSSRERKTLFTNLNEKSKLEKEEAERLEHQMKLLRKREAQKRNAVRASLERTRLTKTFLEQSSDDNSGEEEGDDVEVYAEERDAELLEGQETSSDEEDLVISSRLLVSQK